MPHCGEIEPNPEKYFGTQPIGFIVVFSAANINLACAQKMSILCIRVDNTNHITQYYTRSGNQINTVAEEFIDE